MIFDIRYAICGIRYTICYMLFAILATNLTAVVIHPEES
jgi:hypothetical protein